MRVRKKDAVRLSLYLLFFGLSLIYLILHEHGLSIPCLFENTFHRRCPSCGATRALLAILRLDFPAAFADNGVFAAGIYPVFGLAFLQDFAVTVYNCLKGTSRLSFLQYLFLKKGEPQNE